MNLRTAAAHWGASFYLVAAWNMITNGHLGHAVWQLLAGTALACFAFSRPATGRSRAR